jgi:hypothetical protein
LIRTEELLSNSFRGPGDHADDWTKDDQLRQPVFLGLRTDKDPKEVVREVSIITKADVNIWRRLINPFFVRRNGMLPSRVRPRPIPSLV